MLLSNEFFVFGSGAGIFSLLWLILTQLFGTYDARTIRRTLDRQSEKFDNLLPRLEKLETTIARLIEKTGGEE